MANEKKKRQGFNLFDVIIIVLVLLVAAAGYLILGGSDSEETPTITAVYTLRLNNLPEGSGELILPGETMKENTQNIRIGTVTAVETIPCCVDSYDPETGMVAAAEVDGRETVLVTLEVQAVNSASELAAEGGFALRVGSVVDVSSYMVAAPNSSIVRVERVEG